MANGIVDNCGHGFEQGIDLCPTCVANDRAVLRQVIPEDVLRNLADPRRPEHLHLGDTDA